MRSRDVDTRRQDGSALTEWLVVHVRDVINQLTAFVECLQSCQTNAPDAIKPKPPQHSTLIATGRRQFLKEIVAADYTSVLLCLRARIRLFLEKLAIRVNQP